MPEDDKSLMKHYARPDAARRRPFRWRAPSLTRLAEFPSWPMRWRGSNVDVISTCDFGGDHELVVAQVVAGQFLREGKPFTHVRGNGFHY